MEHYDMTATDAQNAEDLANSKEDDVETVTLCEREVVNTLIQFEVTYVNDKIAEFVYATFRRNRLNTGRTWIDQSIHETLRDAILDAVSYLSPEDQPEDHEMMRMEAQIVHEASHAMAVGKSDAMQGKLELAGDLA